MRLIERNIAGRTYRYSADRHQSGRPIVAERLTDHGWRAVRNIDRLDRIHAIADGIDRLAWA